MQTARIITAFALAAVTLIACRRDSPADSDTLPVFYNGYERILSDEGDVTAYEPCRIDTMTDQSYILLGYSKIDSHLTEITSFDSQELHGEFYSEDADGSYCKGLYVHGKRYGEWIEYNAATDTTWLIPYVADERHGIGCAVPLDIGSDTLDIEEAANVPTQGLYFWHDKEVTLEEFVAITYPKLAVKLDTLSL